jgi:unsaturated chondroitin disaccharide hydrolase
MIRGLFLFALWLQPSLAQRIEHSHYLVENPSAHEFRGLVWIHSAARSFVVTTTHSADLAQDLAARRAFEAPSQSVDGRIAVSLFLKAGERKLITLHTGPADRIGRLRTAYTTVCDSRLTAHGKEAIWESDKVAYVLRAGAVEALGKQSARAVEGQPRVAIGRFALPLRVASPETVAAGPLAAAVRAGRATFTIGRNSRWTEVDLAQAKPLAVRLPAHDGESRFGGEGWVATLAGTPAVGLALYAAPEYVVGARDQEIRLRPGRDGHIRYAFAAYWAREHWDNVLEQGEGDVPLPRVPGMDRPGTSGRILLRPPRMDTAAAFEERLRFDLAQIARPPRVTPVPSPPPAPAPAAKSYDEALALLFGRTRALVEQGKGKFWFSSDAQGAPSFKQPTASWGDGYLVSILWDGYRITRDEWFRTAALEANRAMLGGEVKELHATGLNYWNGSARTHQETGAEVWLRSGLRCADMMTRIADPVTGLIPEYGPAVRRRPADPYDEHNYVKIDALVGLPILWWAYERTGQTRYRDVAHRHALATLHALVEPDGSALQMMWQEPTTGRILGIGTHQGFGGASRWARGLAWVLDGMPDAYRATKEEHYRAQFERSARWLEQNLPDDLISWYDFDDQGVFWRYRDSSTSAICAYGLLRMSELEPDAALARRYRDLGVRLVDALLDRCLTPIGHADRRPPGMLAAATYTKPEEGEFIWGNYSLVRSLCWLKNKGAARPVAPIAPRP